MKRTLVSLLALTPAAAAQIGFTSPRGLAGSLASGLSLSEISRATADDFTLDKPPLNQASPPGPWDDANFPSSADYSLDGLWTNVNRSILGGGTGVDLRQWIEVDAHSTGADYLPDFDPTTGEAVLNQTWLGLIASFDNKAKGTAGSYLEERGDLQQTNPTLRHTPGADLISYYFDGSMGIGSVLPGSNILETTAENMGFGAGDEDIDGLDYGLNVLAHAQTTSPVLSFPNTNWYYFSLSPNVINLTIVNALTSNQFALDGTTWVPADHCSIYRMNWSSGSGWGDVQLFRSAADLDLDGANFGHDLDAIAVNHSTESLLFSTHVHNTGNPATSWSQLRSNVFVGGQTGYLNFDVIDDSELVTAKLDAVDYDDNIDALCGIDPEAGALDTLVGYPTHELYLGNHTAWGLGMTRRQVGGTDYLHFSISGYQGKPATDYLVMFTYGMDPSLYTWATAPNPWLTIGGGQTDPLNPNPIEHTFAVPPGLFLDNCGVVIVTLNDAGQPTGGSWVTQFHM